jgi:hypothetical protein
MLPPPAPGVMPGAMPPAAPSSGRGAADIARAHGLPPPAPKRVITRAEKAGIAGVAVLFVVVVGLVIRGVTGRGSGEPGAAESKPTGTASLSAWLGSSGREGPSAAPSDPAQPVVSTGGIPPEEGRAALDAGEAEAKRCSKKAGPKGRVSVQVTFYPDGSATAQVEIAFGRTPVGICVEEAFRSKARVKPFEGSPVTATRMVYLE